MSERKTSDAEVQRIVRHINYPSEEATLITMTKTWSAEDFLYAMGRLETDQPTERREPLRNLYRMLRMERTQLENAGSKTLPRLAGNSSSIPDMAKRATSPDPDIPASVTPEAGKNLLLKLIARGNAVEMQRGLNIERFNTWRNLCDQTLIRVFGSRSTYRDQFWAAGGHISLDGNDPSEELRAKLSTLNEFIVVLDFQPEYQVTVGVVGKGSGSPSAKAREVFIVHGHDEAAKTKVARLLERLDFVPIILHEQANQGQTIIEKFEKNAGRAGFAVVLLTPDDQGGVKGAPVDIQKTRARQNVVLELGFFIGKLGRENVCVLYAANVELPSDMLGVVYTPLDAHGAWETSLAKELRAAGFTVDFNRL
jgi:predicted nucleotide-binding protein